MNGTPSMTFSTNDKTLRGQMTAILYRYAGEPTVSGASSFSDVKSSAYYASAASWAQKNNILISTVSGSDKFLGGTPISRAEFCAMIYDYAGYKSVDRKTASTAPFSDVKSLSAELLTAINWAYANGVVNGVDKTRFAPNDTLTRAQAVVMLYRYETKFVSGGAETKPFGETTEIPAKPNGTTKTYPGVVVGSDSRVVSVDGAVGLLGDYCEVNIPVGKMVYFRLPTNETFRGLNVCLALRIENSNDGEGCEYKTDVGRIHVADIVDAGYVWIEGYKAGTMVATIYGLPHSIDGNEYSSNACSTVVIRIGGSTPERTATSLSLDRRI